MSTLPEHSDVANQPKTTRIAFDPTRSPREQIEPALATIKARFCPYHPEELLPVDKGATIHKALYFSLLNTDSPHWVQFIATYDRCRECPHNKMRDIEIERCPIGSFRSPTLHPGNCDEHGKPLPQQFGSAKLRPDQSANEQLAAWRAPNKDFICEFSGQALHLRDIQVIPSFDSWIVTPQFCPCLRCGLERLGLTPDEALASFENFLIDPPDIRPHLAACRAFAVAPKGVLLLLGNCGTGKTHLATAIMREFLSRRESHLKFIRHRHFLAKHWLALRPVAFGQEPPESPLEACQTATLLVYDELTFTADNRNYEDVLLDLFEYRIGNFKPTIITANLTPDDLETVLGTRLLDRLRRGTYAVLEFGFESKRKALNQDYLTRIPSRSS